MKKEELKDNIENDVNKIRGALLEMISNNRQISKGLVEQMQDNDFGLLEEYGVLSKSILDASKILTDVHSQTPKIITDIDKVPEEKPKINLDELIND